MKRVFRFSLIILLLSIGCGLNAQNKKATKKKITEISLDSLIFKKLTNRLEVGYINPSQYYSKINSLAYDKSHSTTYFNGISIGLTTELKLKNNLSLLTGVLYNLVYSDKLQKYPSSTFANYISYGHYLNVPVHLLYSYPITKNLKLFGFTGLTLNYGLLLKQNIVSTYNVPVFGITSAYTDLYQSDLNRLDLKVGVGGGVEYKQYQLKAGYNWGVLNINKLDTDILNQKGWFITFGIKL